MRPLHCSLQVKSRQQWTWYVSTKGSGEAGVLENAGFRECLPVSERREGRRKEKTFAHCLTPTTNWAVKFLEGNFRETRQESEESNISWSQNVGGSSREKQKVSSDLINVVMHVGRG